MDEGRPIFLQVAERIESDILDGVMAEETQVPSINELAAFYRINPATALKGINLLVDAGVLYKRRGIGMFVTQGARAQLLKRRRAGFQEEYVRPVAVRAHSLGFSSEQLTQMIREEMGQ